MLNKTTKFFARLLLVIVMTFVFVPVSVARAYSNPAVVPLLTVANFTALAKSAITNPVAGTVLNNGDMGLDSPATCTGFPSPCTGVTTNGTINYGVIQYQNAVALQGQTDATAAVTNIGLRTPDQTFTAQLGGQTLGQGVYEVGAAATNLTGDLTLNGDANSVFIFHLTSTLITDTASRVLLTGGAQACNVFWKVDSSATFNGTTSMVGTVLAQASIDFPAGGATLNGRAIAQTAAITFRNTTVNKSSCASTSSSSSSVLVNDTTSAPASPYCPTISNQIITPIIIESRRVDADSIFVSWGPYSGIDTFNVQYGPENGKWLYNANVTGFSTTINLLPSNQPIWVRIAPRSDCTIGSYGIPKLVGGPKLPNAGFAPSRNDVSWYLLPASILAVISTFLASIH